MARLDDAVKGVCVSCALIARSARTHRFDPGRDARSVTTRTRDRSIPRTAWLAAVAVLVVALAAGGLAGFRALDTTGAATPTPSVALDPPRFVEEGSAAGVEHAYAGDYPYVVGGGIATFDCDADGLADMYLAGGEGPAALYRNRSEIGGPLLFE